MQSHRAVITAAIGTVVMGARGPDDRVLNSLPLAHAVSGCCADVVGALGCSNTQDTP